jgi:dienelactone hydrolase
MEKSGEDDLATYYRCFVKVTAEMDSYGLYIVPKKAKLPAPLVISLHGNAGYPEAALFHGGAVYFDMVRGPLREGYVVYAPQMVVHSSRDAPHGSPIPEDVLGELDGRFKKADTSLVAVEAARITKALDAILQRPEVEPGRVGMVGLSYGGFMTLRTAALDPRIKAAVVSGGFFSRRSSATDQVLLIDLPGLVSPRALQFQ